MAYEHRIQDGGSRDGTLEWLDQASGADSATRLRWQSEPDFGMYDAINRAWGKSSGDILSWLNADEQYLPGTLHCVEQVFSARPDVDVVWGDTLMASPSGECIGARREIPLRQTYVRYGFLYALSCSMFFRRRLWEEGVLRMDGDLRAAGDADLVLRLLIAQKRFHHVRGYLGIFGVDGNNMSVAQSNRMRQEVAELRTRYRCAMPRVLGPLVMGVRHMERLAAGCYRKSDVTYDYALDAKPNYLRICGRRVTGRFTYSRAMKTPSSQRPGAPHVR